MTHINFKLYNSTLTLVSIMGLIMLLIGILGFNFIYSKIMYVIVGLMMLIFSSIAIIRMKLNKDKFGEIVMTHSWCIFSTGLGGLMIYLAPFFKTGSLTPVLEYVSLTISVIVLLLALMLIIYTKTRLNIPLTI